MKRLLKNITIAIFSLLILNSCGESSPNGSSNPPATDFAPKSAGGFEDTFLNYTIYSPSGNKATVLTNKQARYFIANQVLSGSYIYSYTKKNTATIKHIIGGITCNQTLTFTSQTSGNMNETCQGSNGVIDNINQNSNGSFNITRTNVI